MNKERIFILISCLALIFGTYVFYNKIRSYSELKKSENEKAVLVIPIISDVHIGGFGADIKFQEVLKDYRDLYEDYDAIAIVGDIVDNSKTTNYERFKEILYKEIPDGADTIIAMGNHEYYFENLSKKQYEYRFLKEIGRNTLYYDKWIKGYHFIALAPEHQESAMISENQITWLKEKLKESKDSRPIFVFLHQPFKDTVFGSENGSDIENNDELYDILKSYPQIIFFSGHSHYDLESEKTFFKREFNMINTSSIYYVMNYEDTNEPIYKTQGLVAEIYKSKVIIRRREFITKEWIGEPYIIKYKNDTYKSVR